MSASNDGSESVDHFLARIASLKEGRDENDLVRTRQMEDDILKGRQERQARRLERARSISPSKTGPAKLFSATPSSRPASQTTNDLVINPPVDFSPQSQRQSQSQTPSLSRSNALTGRTSPTKDLDATSSRPLPSTPSFEEPSRPLSTPTGLARSGTLSWQQRPSSRDGPSPRQRPLSTFATTRNLPRPPSQEESDQEPSRKDIAASLAQKDPTWFRQTQDRGISSAAYRKNQVEDLPEPLHATSMRLPGLSQAREPSKSPTPEARSERAPHGNALDADRSRRANTPDMVALRDSMSMDKNQARLQQDTAASRPLSLEREASDSSTPSLARTSSVLSSNRPVSPTKGLGGFVESAMMRRSDSVNKRWSVRANAGLKRGDSVVGGRPTSMHSRGLSRDLYSSKEGTPSSPLASSRPTSSHDRDQPAFTTIREKSMSVEPPETTETKPEYIQNTLTVEVDDSHLARSPSKTMDPRRWSPTKSTWLESALQAEPPKPAPLKEEQPKWIVDLQRSKSRASRDMSPEKRLSKQQVVTPAASASPPISKSPPPAVLDSRKPALPVHAAHSRAESSAEVAESAPVSTSEVVQEQMARSNSTPAPKASSPEPKETAEVPRKPPVLRPKPQTPPKTDFRSALRSRGTGPTQNNEAEPEFKAMFGKLKRATTQNYVAPDELKTNILTGKAALNTTEGPQKTQRVDEFRESLLAKKEVMKTSGSMSPQRSVSPTKEEYPIPEALVRRKTLSKASAPNLNALQTTPRGATPVTAPKPASILRPLGTTAPEDQKTHTAKPEVPLKAASATQRTMHAPAGRVQSMEAKHVPVDNGAKVSARPLPSEPRPSSSVQSIKPVLLETESEVGHSSISNQTATISSLGEGKVADMATKQEPPAENKLASRLNPNLAAMLSRGGPSRPQGSRGVSSDEVFTLPNPPSTNVHTEDNATGSLTHMTKARAKGPKRRAPKTETTSVTDSVQPKSTAPPKTRSTTQLPIQTDSIVDPLVTTKVRPLPLKPSTGLREIPQPRVTSTNQAPIKPKPEKQESVPKVEEPKIEAVRARPTIAGKSSELRKVSSSAGIDERLGESPKPSVASKLSWSPAAKHTSTGNPSGAVSAQSDAPAKPVPSSFVFNSLKDLTVTNQPRNDVSEDVAMKPILPQSLEVKAVRSAPKPVAKPRVLPQPANKENSKSSILPREIRSIIESYVGPVLKDYEKGEFDSQRFLIEGKDSEQRVKTTNQTVNEVSGDGKKSPLPPQQEHILYEECMYLITHTFSAGNGVNTSEVYLWCGDRASDASVEDAQIFCRRDAREHGTKLEVVKQGKESSRLLQALGGILIVRRSKSSALYMLCGRRHLGHIVFDEVEMDSNNLCPGYTYLISAQYGKLYLWKGRGAGADEIGSARLIGMDLGLTGEIEEVDDGAEASSFWEVFGSRPQTQWSDDWSRRADSNGYPTVMYRVEHERPGLLGNLWGLKRAASPSKGQAAKATCERLESFSQNDLESAAIHMVDAYRNIYVVITRQSSSKAAELVTALHLAQEFAMLSPATQDRPLLPTCHVIVGDLTTDSKACFRKWSALQAQSLARKESICVRLEEVMEALNL